MKTLRLLLLAMLIMRLTSLAVATGPDTDVDILATPLIVPEGGTIDLEVCETNTGDILLYFIYVNVFKGGELISCLEYPPDGDSGNGDDVLDPGETWTWNTGPLQDIPVTEPTWLTAIGKGLDPHQGYGEVTYPDYPNELDDVYVSTSGTGNQPPVAVVDGPYGFTGAGSEVLFDGSGSYDPDGDPLKYYWDFGDNSTSSGPYASHTYSGDGPYIVTLRVIDPGDLSDTASVTVEIRRPPVAVIDGPHGFTGAGSEVLFDASGSYDPDGDPLTYQWNFGDGNTGTGPRVSHTYSGDGPYTVTLTVTDPGGLYDRTSVRLDLNRPPVAIISGFCGFGSTPSQVVFDGTDSFDPDGDPLKYYWKFSDGETGTTPTAYKWYYDQWRIHYVTLTVVDPGGLSDSTTAVVRLLQDPPPMPIPIDFKPQGCPNPLNVESEGVFPVAIYGTECFDVVNIDPFSIILAGMEPLKCSIEDVSAPVEEHTEDCECVTAGPDGYLDLIVKFDTQQIVAGCGMVEDGDVLGLILRGELCDGTPIEGHDMIRIIKKGQD